MIETQLLNAVIASRDFNVLVKHGLNHRKHFIEQQKVYDYINNHLKEYGEMPSVESTVAACDDFEAVDVVESTDTLCYKLEERNLKLAQKDALKKLAEAYGEKDAYKLMEAFRKQFEELDAKAMSRSRNGSNWATNGEDRLEEYKTRQEKDFSVTIPFFFDEFTEATGGAERGDVCTIMASTGEGKSWLGLLQGVVSHNAGYRVLLESAEMSKPENEFRLDSLNGGFSNRGLWTGQLDNEGAYEKYLEKFKRGTQSPDFIIKTAEDWKDGLTLQQLEYDIDRTKADVVIIDQFNLMRFKGNSKDDKAAFSRQLKQLAAKKGIVVFLLYQTNGDYIKNQKKGEDGIAELQLPTLGDYSETIAVIQDSAKVFGWTSITWTDKNTGRKRGKGLGGVLKSRTGGGGVEVDVDFQPNDGIIRPRQPSDLF